MAIEERVTISTPEAVEIDLLLAGLGSRFMAALVDVAIQLAAIFALGFGLGVAVGLSDPDVTSGWAAAAFLVLSFLVVFGYDVAFETLADGRTPGKRAMGLRVVRAGGQPEGFLTAAVRNFLRLVDFLPAFYLVGVISIVGTERNQRLGDLAAGTLVVKERIGGRGGDPSLAAWSGTVTVPVDAVSRWDVSAVTADDMTVVRHFLDRRLTLPSDARWRLSWELASRLAAKVPGVPPDAHPEYVLEGIVQAKSARR